MSSFQPHTPAPNPDQLGHLQPQLQHPQSAPPIRPNRWWLVPLLIVGAVFVVGAFFIGSLALIVWATFRFDREDRLEAQLDLSRLEAQLDRSMLLEIDDLAKHIDGFTPDSKWESFTEGRDWSDDFELEYDYCDLDSDDSPVMTCKLSLSGVSEYNSALIGHEAAHEILASSGVEVIERNDLIRWGDQSVYCVEYLHGKPYGNTFVAQRGKIFFNVSWTGVAFTERDAVERFLKPVLSKLDQIQLREH